MLNELHIENIAVIEHADILFDRGLNVLGGETGAGKSIVIDAINAVLGNRTSRELVRKGASSALVTAVFTLEKELPWFSENDIPYEEELILQRKITPEGKSSSRVCGVPVAASQLRELASQLVDIHGQNDGLRLLDEKSHLSFLDNFGETDGPFQVFRSEYEKYSSIRKELKQLSLNDEEKQRMSDALHFRIDELEKADLKEGEYETVTARRDLLRNSEKLRESLDSALSFLREGEENAESLLQNGQYFAERAARLVPELEDAAKSLKDASFLLSDAAETLSDFRESLDFSPEEYDLLENRVAQLDRLSRKYSRDEKGLIALLEESRRKLEEIEYSEDRIARLKRDLKAQKEACVKAGGELS